MPNRHGLCRITRVLLPLMLAAALLAGCSAVPGVPGSPGGQTGTSSGGTAHSEQSQGAPPGSSGASGAGGRGSSGSNSAGSAGDAAHDSSGTASSGGAGREELRGVWISYLELKGIFSSQQTFEAGIDKMFDDAKSLNLNAVFVHVRAFSDAFYPSKYFPWSAYITGTQGKDPGYDPLDYMVKAAHARGLEFHAWINPYRVSATSTDPKKLSETNPARVWMTDADASNDDWAVKAAGGIYYNPASVEVQALVINGIREIVDHYDVDGVHFDDYFYPVTSASFDQAAYARYQKQAGGGAMSLGDWRRTNVSALISGVYHAIKARSKDIVFGVSPFASIEKNYDTYYADVCAWSQGGYLDYLMPQLYFGFEYPKAEFRFDALAEAWRDSIDTQKTALYFGLASYKLGTEQEADAPEWNNSGDLLRRQVEYIRDTRHADGFVFYSYTSLFSGDELCTREREQLRGVL